MDLRQIKPPTIGCGPWQDAIRCLDVTIIRPNEQLASPQLP
jgi:hypothetical protein